MVTLPLCGGHPKAGRLFKTVLAYLNVKNHPGTVHTANLKHTQAPILLLHVSKRGGSAKVRGASLGLDASAEEDGAEED